MSKHLVREDEDGIYVNVGGWKTRPVLPFSITAAVGEKVTASHSGGPWARVNGSYWAIERESDWALAVNEKYKNRIGHI